MTSLFLSRAVIKLFSGVVKEYCEMREYLLPGEAAGSELQGAGEAFI